MSFLFLEACMEGDYYIGNRKRCKKRLSRPKRILLLLCTFTLALILLFQAVLLPQVRALCEAAVSNRLEALASKKTYELLRQEALSYTDFILLRYDTDGGVRSASVDTVKLNLFKTALATQVLEALVTQDITVSVPRGNLLGVLFFSGMGGDARITARVANGMHARLHSAFTTEGINQTRHEIGFSLDFTAYYLLPTGTERLSFSVGIPLGETLIVGDVPDSLTQINRLNEEISEIEIDDAVDFGHILS